MHICNQYECAFMLQDSILEETWMITRKTKNNHTLHIRFSIPSHP